MRLGLAHNQPFVDGNKRTAYVVCRTFLRLNGRDLDASQEEKYLTFLRLAERPADGAGFGGVDPGTLD